MAVYWMSQTEQITHSVVKMKNFVIFKHKWKRLVGNWSLRKGRVRSGTDKGWCPMCTSSGDGRNVVDLFGNTKMDKAILAY
jgi:hypothetical protein